MLISICIPHYNRVQYLLLVLESIRKQNYENIEIIISDDCSSDDSEQVVTEYIGQHEHACRVRFCYIRQPKNLGYDGNLRASLAAAQGEYLFVLGNDDALSADDTIARLVSILEQLHFPDVAFTNFYLAKEANQVVRRAKETAIIGSGPAIAVRTFRSFSFVGGIVMKRSEFRKYNTDAYDGSIYVQIYLAARIIAAGGVLATIAESMVAKDICIAGEEANSYLDTLAQDNQVFTRKTGGLDQVGRVGCDAILPHVTQFQRAWYAFKIYGQILCYSYPYWLYNYRKNGVYRAAVNLALGCFPQNLVKTSAFPVSAYGGLVLVYIGITGAGLVIPIPFLDRLTHVAYRLSRAV